MRFSYAAESELTLQILLEFAHVVLTKGGDDTLTGCLGREARFDAPVTGRDVDRWVELLDEVGRVCCVVVAKDEHIEGGYVRQ